MAQETLILGMSIPNFLQTLSVAVAAIALFFNANQLKALRTQNSQNEKKARQRATIDLALHEKVDVQYLDCKKKFILLRDTPGNNFTQYACDILGHKDQNDIIFAYLNHYEFLACGIFEEALDGEIYKRMRKTSVINDWNALKPYIYELRKQRNNQKLYCEFEKLVHDWEKS